MHPRKKEFLELLDASGWSQAEAARQLGLTRGGLNGFVRGPTVPSEATMRLFRLVLLSEKPESVKQGTRQSERTTSKELAALQSDLEALPEGQRERLIEALRAVIAAAKA